MLHTKINNILTFDIEDWFHITPLNIQQKNWNNLEHHVMQNTTLILNVLKEKKIKATFFILGWIAEKYPDLVIRIHRAGHEIASHGYAHVPVSRLNKNSFTRDLEKSLTILKKIIKKDIIGYRACSFSITRETCWALDILQENGIKYDSSILPVAYSNYGIKNSPGTIYRIPTKKGEIREFPPTVKRICGNNINLGGGASHRLLPYFILKHWFMNIRKQGQPLILYYHPWDFDPDFPEIRSNLKIKYLLEFGRKNRYNTFHKLLDDFSFGPVKDHLNKTLKG